MAINTFFYDEQLKNYILQFAAVFTGMHYMTGFGALDPTTGENTPPQLVPIPVHVGSKDRVVAAIAAGNTQNKPFGLPIMSVNLANLELAPERRHGTNIMDRRVTLKYGGVFPEDLTVVRRVMPIPYNAQMELILYASNTQQMHQMLEQILLMFDPTLQIQTSDSNFDWTKITSIELTGINNEENYPSGTDRRMVIWSLNFAMPLWISAPMDTKDQIVKEIYIRIGDLSEFNVSEVNENGELQPFSNVYFNRDKNNDGVNDGYSIRVSGTP